MKNEREMVQLAAWAVQLEEAEKLAVRARVALEIREARVATLRALMLAYEAELAAQALDNDLGH